MASKNVSKSPTVDVGDLQDELTDPVRGLLENLEKKFEDAQKGNKKVTVSLVEEMRTVFTQVLRKMISNENVMTCLQNTAVKTDVMMERLEDIARKLEDEKIEREGLNKLEENFVKKRLFSEVLRGTPPEVQEGIIIIDSKKPTLEIRDKLRDVNRQNKLVKPKDITMTKQGRTILKFDKIENADEWMDALNISSYFNDNTSCRKAKPIRHKMIIFGVPAEIEEQMLIEDIKSIPGIENRDIEVVRNFSTRAGTKNWIIGVDKNTRLILWEKSRICIDLVRVKIDDYADIKRCYKCQGFGHFAQSCRGELTCGNCAEPHSTIECKSDVVSCPNCNGYHKASYSKCPMFLEFKRKALDLLHLKY